MGKHTPGPWQHEVHEGDHRGTGVIWALRPDWEPGMYTSPNNKVVAEVSYQAGEHRPWRGSEGEEFEANARLIAAAPEMLEIMERALRLAREHRDFSLVAMEPFWEVIAKAKGKTVNGLLAEMEQKGTSES